MELHSDKSNKTVVKKPEIAVRQQYGVLPYRDAKKTGLEFLLVTSRETHRWIVPKGWPIRGLKPPASAAREAYEEAGLRGAVRSRSIGSYLYEKLLDEKRRVVPCEVKVYPMQVRRLETTWPEQAERTRLWFSPAAAVAAVSDDGVKTIIGDFVNDRQKFASSRSKVKSKAKTRGKSMRRRIARQR